MILYPKFYCRSIIDIDIEFLNKNKIKGLILDVDNTLIDTDKNLLDGAIEWHENIKNKGIKTIIVSNSNKKEKLDNVSKKLDIEYISFAKKPFKGGFKKALKKLELAPENVAAVGDQIFTDVIGANRCKIFSILVEPINEQDLWITKWKRPIEKKIVDKYLRTKEGKVK